MEAMLTGNWKNVQELEDSLTLGELELLVSAAREKEHRMMRFYGLFKGVDLDEQSNTQDKFDEIKKRADAKLLGKTEDEIDFAALGIEVETM